MLINEAFAQAVSDTAQTPDFTLTSLLPLIGILIIFYFLLIRPQTKRAKEQKQMQNELQKGDEIIIAGGELGRVVNTDENYITMEIAPNLVITVLKTSIQTLLPKGTLRSIEAGKGNRAPKNNKQKTGDTQRDKPEENETDETPQTETSTATPGRDDEKN